MRIGRECMNKRHREELKQIEKSLKKETKEKERKRERDKR